MYRQAEIFSGIALFLAFACSVPFHAAAETAEVEQGESPGRLEPINPVEPEIVPAAPPKKWRLDGSVSASAVYNDNIFISSSHKEGDFLFTISPAISLTLGAPDGDEAGYVTLNYAPGFTHFAKQSSEDSLSQSVLLGAGYRFTRLTLGLSVGYSKGREAEPEVGTRVDRQNYSAALTSKYEVTDRSSVELNLSRSFSGYEGFLDVSDMVVQGYFNSRVTEAFTLGLGVAYGIAEVQGGSSRSYEQVTIRGTYTATERLSFTANLGADFRDSGHGTQFGPIFGVSATYKLSDSTDLSLSGSRSIVPSAAFAQEDKEATSLFLSVRQRFLQRYFLGGTVGYDHTKYRSSTSGLSQSRSDDSIGLGLSASTNLTDRWSVQVFYQYRRNTSTAQGFSFTNQQIGVSSGLTF